MKDKKFMKKPEYPGGADALKEFVKNNLTQRLMKYSQKSQKKS